MRKHLAIAVAIACTAAGCAFSSPDSKHTGTRVVLATHDSWAMDKEVMKAFEKQSGYHVEIRPQGDAGTLTNKLVLTKDAPIADAVYGIDNTFASRAVDRGVLRATTLPLPPGAQRFALTHGSDRLAPVDYGDVCINIDDTWFAKKHLEPPRTLADLTRPAYRNLLVVPGANSSSPGLAFLLATIAAQGTQWPAYWRKLVDNGIKIDAGWTDAYTVDFTAGGGNGDRPIVLSYASSPPFTIPEGGSRPTTSSLPRTCFRQVEYAGVVKGADNPKGAKALLQFMLSRKFQRALPEQMYVFPVDRHVALPPTWQRWAKVPAAPYTLPETEIARKRASWLREWRDVIAR